MSLCVNITVKYFLSYFFVLKISDKTGSFSKIGLKFTTCQANSFHLVTLLVMVIRIINNKLIIFYIDVLIELGNYK